MSDNAYEASRTEVEEVIQRQAASNPKYREMLLSKPKALLEQQLGHRLPESLAVEVIQETPSKIFIRLPHTTSEGDELADEYLEQVAGGKTTGGGDKVMCMAPASAGGFASKNEIHV